jgi:two-component system chemotaxis response regulator CheB
MRALIGATLSQDQEIRIVGEAAGAAEAREKMKALDPDVVTLDIEMPGMSGLDFLERIMRLRPTRIIIISSLTAQGAATTIRALELGAMECVAKPSSKDRQSLQGLGEKIKAIAAAPLPRGRSPRSPGPSSHCAAVASGYESDSRVVAIGASMGGVEALLTVLSSFPENCPPTVICQHMREMFTQSFANRLDKICKPTVQEARDGCPLRPGLVYIAPGGGAHLEVANRNGLSCRLRHGPPVSGHRPSIDALFHSVAQTAKADAVGVILTGMGRDGAEGLLAMRDAGGETIGQDEATAVVYGMPRVAYERGAVGLQLPLSKIGERILTTTNANQARARCQ